MSALAHFHPAVRRWFEGRFPEGPSAPQRAGWPAIARREHTLIAAPTGSGKTLAAFLVCIDELYRRSLAGARFGCSKDAPFRLEAEPAEPAARRAPEQARPPGIEVVYVSPLKALAADIQENLARPLREIEATARAMGLPVPEIRVALRSGDSSPSERAALVKTPPQILVTTPESLYLLLTSARGREILRPVHTLIVDEIHAMARDKRGAHLALSLERLEALADQSPTRIGLSATQRPIERIAQLLVGAGPDRVDASGAPRCAIVDVGHSRALDLAVVLPGSELEAVASGEQMGEVLAQIAGEVEHHRTTLVFVNTRRMAERLAHQLAERLGEEGVAAHHGSLSKERRLRVETALREGRLRALVATASLELGIDVGPVELVCQIGSPRSIATFLQRVGRSGHFLGGLPKGRLYPLSRDELVECAGLLRAIRGGRLDRLHPPEAPLDILAQQIVAACAAEPWKEEALYRCFRAAAPYASLSRETFDEVVELVSNGIATGRGRRAAWIHRDRIGGMLRARRGARLAALTSGGAIPDVADYRVVADPDETFIGTVGEDFAIDSLPGDVFLLGSSTWRIRRVEAGKLRVVDAEGASPNIPFWAGEAPARTEELSDEVSDLRAALEPLLARGDEAGARAWLQAEAGPAADACEQIARYPRSRAPRSAACRPGIGWCSSASSTMRAACSSCSILRAAGGSTARSVWRCARSSVATSTSSCRLRRTTTRWSSRSGRTTASRSPTSRASSLRADSRTRSGRRCSRRRSSRRAGAGTCHARSRSCASAAAGRIRPRSSAWKPTISWPPSFQRPRPARRTSPARSRSRTIRSCARRCATA